MRFARYLLLIVACLVASCGGSGDIGGSSEGGRVRLVIHWPETREIPAATQSLNFKVVTLITNDENQIVEKEQVKEQVVQRPTGQTVSTVVLEDLPSVKVRVKATAHESTDGTGAVLASGSVDITVSEAGTVNAAITLVGDISLPARFDASLFTATSLTDEAPVSLSNEFGSSSASFGSVSCSITSEGAPFTGVNSAGATFQDNLIFEAPGMFGQDLVGDAVFNITVQADANTTVTLMAFNKINPGIGSEVRVPLSTLSHGFGGPNAIRLTASLSRTGSTEPGNISITFLRFEGLPAGTTVRSASGDTWADVP